MKTLDHIKNGLQQKAQSKFSELSQEQRAFVDWMAYEIYGLYRELGNSRDYIKRNILRRILPEMNTRPKPAHALVQAQPNKAGQVLRSAGDPFVARRMGNEAPNEIYFTPLQPVQLAGATVRWRCFDHTIEELLDGQMTKQVAQALHGSSLHPGTLWLGIELLQGAAPPSRLVFHVAPGQEQADSGFYRSLPLIQWAYQGENVPSIPGMAGMFAKPESRQSQALDPEYLHLYALEKAVMENYDEQFLGLERPGGFQPHEVPADINMLFEEGDMEPVRQNNCVWVKLVFPSGFSPADIRQVKVRLNCFPVLNRKMDKSCDFDADIERPIEIRPLSNRNSRRNDIHATGDYFLGIERIFSGNTTYRATTFERFWEMPPGYYALQYARVEASDFRDLLCRVEELAFLIKNHEARLRHAVEHEIQEILEELTDGCRKLEKQLQNAPGHAVDPGYYLHLKAAGSDMVYVEFWLSQGGAAEGVLSAGDLLEGKGEADVAWVVDAPAAII